MKLTQPTLDSMPIHRPQPGPHRPQHLCADKGYDYPCIRRLAQRRHYIAHIKSRGVEAAELRRNPHAKARRWVNERAHSWINRFRRLLIRWEKKAANYQALLQFAAAWSAFRAAKVFG
jgi:transposase